MLPACMYILAMKVLEVQKRLDSGQQMKPLEARFNNRTEPFVKCHSKISKFRI